MRTVTVPQTVMAPRTVLVPQMMLVPQTTLVPQTILTQQTIVESAPAMPASYNFPAAPAPAAPQNFALNLAPRAPAAEMPSRAPVVDECPEACLRRIEAIEQKLLELESRIKKNESAIQELKS